MNVFNCEHICGPRKWSFRCKTVVLKSNLPFIVKKAVKCQLSHGIGKDCYAAPSINIKILMELNLAQKL